MRVIGLTGGISTGKSAVISRICADGSFPEQNIIDCDKIAREVVAPGTSGFDAIYKAFAADGVFDDTAEGKVLDRKKLGKIVFADEGKRKILVGITGPRIFKAIMMRLLYHWMIGTAFVIIDAPTLFETKSMVNLCASIIVIATDADVQLKRLMIRDNINEEEAKQKINAQLPIAEKVAKADVVIWNNGTKEELYDKVDKVMENLHHKHDKSISRIFSAPGLVALALVCGSLLLISRKLT